MQHNINTATLFFLDDIIVILSNAREENAFSWREVYESNAIISAWQKC